MATITEPIWTSEEKNRKRGATSFVTCGWCKHATTGSMRYDCTIDGRCNLFEYGGDVQWNTPCKLIGLGQKDLVALAESKRSGAQSARDSAERKDCEADELIVLSSKAKDTPVSPDHRNHDHFNLNDRVSVFLNGAWHHGTVVNGYRHHDGCVSFDLDTYPNKGIGCGMSVPTVMLKSEFDYFQRHPNDWHTWIMAQDRVYNGERLPISDIQVALGTV